MWGVVWRVVCSGGGGRMARCGCDRGTRLRFDLHTRGARVAGMRLVSSRIGCDAIFPDRATTHWKRARECERQQRWEYSVNAQMPKLWTGSDWDWKIGLVTK